MNEQEFEAEKRSFREQFDDIAKRKAEIEEMQRPLVNECTALKRQIDSFEETKSDLAVSQNSTLDYGNLIILF